MSLTRVRWLTAVCLSLGITPLCQAQEVWRPVARSVAPAVIASAGSPPANAAPPVVTIGKPIAIASSAPTMSPPALPVVVRAAHQGGTIIRGQAPDLDSGSPYPPPVLTAPGGMIAPGVAVAAGPYTSQEVGRFNAPAMDGVTIPQIEMAPSPTSGDPVYSTPAGVATLPPPPPVTIPAVTIGLPRGQETRTVSATMPAVGPVDPPPPSASDLGTAPPQPIGSYSPYSISNQPDSVAPPGVVPPPADITPGVATDRAVAPGFWEKCRHLFDFGDRGTSSGRCSFQSDHSFDAISSPVTMPFYAEDPRSLTEVKPIFIYQRIPGNTPNFGGGNVTFFGTQARLAVTERFSVVMSELGYLWLDPRNPVDPAQRGSGFSEIKIGPKYTFLRNCDTGTLGAFGVNFELPVGSGKNFQNTGSASIDPYFSFAQSFGRLPAGFGSLNFMNTTGYSASVDRTRSEFFYTQLHLDYNVANANKFFPLVELNWLHYTSSGNRGDLGTEGADLINLGSSTRQGKDYVSLAGGLRYRFTDNIQAGAAVEVPTTRETGLSSYRLTFDVIFRY
jgi:hypothetical protein